MKVGEKICPILWENPKPLQQPYWSLHTKYLNFAFLLPNYLDMNSSVVFISCRIWGVTSKASHRATPSPGQTSLSKCCEHLMPAPSSKHPSLFCNKGTSDVVSFALCYNFHITLCTAILLQLHTVYHSLQVYFILWIHSWCSLDHKISAAKPEHLIISEISSLYLLDK